MRRRLFAHDASAEADVRPTLLGVVTLLFLLLFFLLGTTSGNKLAVVGLGLTSEEGVTPLPHSGLLQGLDVQLGLRIAVTARVQTTDIAAASSQTEVRRSEFSFDPEGLRGLDAVLAELKALDPAQERASVTPEDAVTTEQLVTVLDLVRGPAGSRFPKVVLR